MVLDVFERPIAGWLMVPHLRSAGDCCDDAMTKSFFFARQECQPLDRVCFLTPVEVRLAVFEFIER